MLGDARFSRQEWFFDFFSSPNSACYAVAQVRYQDWAQVVCVKVYQLLAID